MGWWTAGADDMMGDGPLDAVGEGLARLAAEREAGGSPPPTPHAFLAAAVRAFDAAGWPVGALHARLEPSGETVAATADDAAEPALVRALTDLLLAVAAEYDEGAGREPRLAELLLALRLGLVPEPERHLDVDDGTRVSTLTATDDGPRAAPPP